MAKILLEIFLAGLWVFGICVLGLFGLFKIWPLVVWTLGMVVASRLCKAKLSY